MTCSFSNVLSDIILRIAVHALAVSLHVQYSKNYYRETFFMLLDQNENEEFLDPHKHEQKHLYKIVLDRTVRKKFFLSF